jgi:hypothetical protein
MAIGAEVRLADGDHVVQFYEHDQDLVDVVVSYLASALAAGESVVVIARDDHRQAFASGLGAAGVDTAVAEAEGRLVALDARSTLARFMVDGRPDGAAFDAVVGEVIRQAAAGGRAVRAYGEMVALLWQDGDVTGAMEVEDLWNTLAEQLPFSLFCAYPAGSMADGHGAYAFAEVCHRHSSVVAGAPAPGGSEVTRRFLGPRGPWWARRFVAEVLTDWGRTDVLDDCLLVVSELASNAVRHAGSDFTVSLGRAGEVVTVVVGDSCAAPPAPRQPDDMSSTGRGLHLVGAVAGEWGYLPAEDGKLVWAHLGPPGETKAS